MSNSIMLPSPCSVLPRLSDAAAGLAGSHESLQSVDIELPDSDRCFRGPGPTPSTTTASPATPPAWC